MPVPSEQTVGPHGKAVDRLRPSKLSNRLELLGDNIDLSSLNLALRGSASYNVLEAITDGTITRTIEGASTIKLTLNDRDRRILRSPYLTSKTDILIDGLWFRLCNTQKQDDELTLTLEDREVSILRAYPKEGAPHNGFLHWPAASVHTRAEFARHLVSQPGRDGVLNIRFRAPSLDNLPPPKPTAADPQEPSVVVLPDPKGHITASQLIALWQSAGATYGVPWNVLAAINKIETAFGTNQGPSSAGAIGWMQFLPSTWASYGVDADGDGKKDPASPADAIYGAARYLAASGASRSLEGAIFAYNHSQVYVAEVMGLAAEYADGNKPSQALKDALADGIGPGSGAGATATPPAATSFETTDTAPGFTRGTKTTPGSVVVWTRENNWDCVGRLASEVKWRRFCVSGEVWFVSDQWLFKQPAHMKISEDSPGVDSINVDDYDVRKKTVPGVITVTGRVSRWQAPPGTLVELQHMGVFSGKWLVSEIERPIFGTQGTFTLVKPVPALPEHQGPEWGAGANSGVSLSLVPPLPGTPGVPAGGNPIVGIAQDATAQIAAALLIPYIVAGRLTDHPDIRATARGQAVTNANGEQIYIDVRVMQLLLWLLQNEPAPVGGTAVTIGVSAICSDHRLKTTSGRVSAHPYGRAVDINVINGHRIDTDTAATKQQVLALDQLIRSAVPPLTPAQLITGGYGNHLDADCQALCVPSAATYNDGHTLQEHTNHVHVGYA